MPETASDIDLKLSYVDAHCHIGHDVDGTQQTAELLLEKMEQCGIDHAIIFPFNEIAQTHCFKKPNTHIAEIMKKYSRKFTGFCRLNPHDSCVISELQRCVNVLGLRGIKLHPGAQSIDIDAPYMMPIYELSASYNIPILVHTSGFVKGITPVKLVNIVQTFPNVNFLVGHSYKAHYSVYGSIEPDAHSDAFEKLLELAKQQKNIYFETSFLPTTYLEGLIEKVGAIQVVFGSDSPYGDPCWEKLTIEALNIPENEKIKICKTNIFRLIK